MNDILATDGAYKHLASLDAFFLLLNYPPQSKSKAFDRGEKSRTVSPFAWRTRSSTRSASHLSHQRSLPHAVPRT